MNKNVFKSINSIVFKSGIFSFIAYGLAMILFVTLFLWITENNLRELIEVENEEHIHSIVSQFDINIDSYRNKLKQDSNSPIFVSAVMSSSDTEYYLRDYMVGISIADLPGELLLLSYDGVIIENTIDETNLIGSKYKDYDSVVKNVEDKRSFQLLDADNNIVFISSILYNEVAEGYLVFITPFHSVFEANNHLFKSEKHNHSFYAINEGQVIAYMGEEKEDFLKTTYPLGSLPVSLEIITNYEIIEQPISKILSSIILISSFFVIILSVIISFISARNMTRPLSILEVEILNIGIGKLNSLPFRKKDPIEIKFLRESFNSMQESLNEKKYALEDSNKKLVEINTDLKSAQKQLVQNEKMASIGQLAAGVAHEINNPTGFVTTNLHTMAEYIVVYNNLLSKNDLITEYLKKQKNTDKIITDLVAEIKSIKEEEDFDFIQEDSDSLLRESIDGVNRIKKIVNGLRNFARTDSAVSESGNINDAIEDALRLTLNELKYTCEIKKELSTIPNIQCRLDQLTQVFVNLFVNAAHAIKDHGLIIIKTWVEEKFIFASVQDNGSGIPAENLQKLFDPFFTTKEVGKGTGLGLSISYGIIEEHGGEIEVSSTVGEGTTFNIKLPLQV